MIALISRATACLRITFCIFEVYLLSACFVTAARAQGASTTVPATPVQTIESRAVTGRAPNGVPVVSTCSEAELDKGVLCPDFYHPNTIRAQVWMAFQARNFAQVDTWYTQWCSGKGILPDGRWNIREFSDAFDAFGTVMTWEKGLAEIQAWQASNPSSEAARFIESRYWDHYAWFARGAGYARSVSEEGWQLFGERLDKSKKILAELIASHSQCPIVYSSMIGTMSLIGATEEQMRTIYTEAVGKFPNYHGIYFAMAQHYEPRWGGSLEAFEAFADESTRLTKGYEGAGMYARLYWTVDSPYGTPFVDKNTRFPQWPKLKAGFEDLLRKYPSSMHNLAQYASVACRAGDAQLYRSLRARLVGFEQVATEDSGGSVRFDACDRKHGWTVGRAANPESAPASPVARSGAEPSFAPAPPDRLPGDCTEADLAKQALCADFSMRDELSTYVQMAFFQDNFGGLDQVFDRWCTTSLRKPDGVSRLPDYAAALRAIFRAYPRWDEYGEAIRAWQREAPNSIASRFVEAVYWHEYGWSARGYRRTAASHEEMEIFRERLKRARLVLQALRQVEVKCATPDALLVTVLGDLGVSEAELQKTFSIVTGAHPHEHELYFAMAQHYQPRSGGNARDFDAFANVAASQTRTLEGMGLYSRLYEQLDADEDLPLRMDARSPVWEKIQAGYQDLMRHYPSSMAIVIHFASFACRSDDASLYRSLRAKFAGHEEDAFRVSAGAMKVDLCDKKLGWKT